MEIKGVLKLPPDRLNLAEDRVFCGSGYVYRKNKAGGLIIDEIRFNTSQGASLTPFFYNKPVENSDDPFEPPHNFVRDKTPRQGYYPLSYVELALRPPNHLYEVDDAVFTAVNRGSENEPEWETRYFPKNSLDAQVWEEALIILRITPPLEIRSKKGRLNLRQFTPAIASDIFDLIDGNRDHLSQFGDETARKYLTYESLLESIVNPKNLKRLRFAIRNSQGEVMGSINVTPDEDNPHKGEIGYYIGSEYQGRGFTTEAAELLTNFAMGELGYTELYAKVHPHNIASQKVLLKAGYQDAGTKDGDVLFTVVKLSVGESTEKS